VRQPVRAAQEGSHGAASQPLRRGRASRLGAAEKRADPTSAGQQMQTLLVRAQARVDSRVWWG